MKRILVLSILISAVEASALGAQSGAGNSTTQKTSKAAPTTMSLTGCVGTGNAAADTVTLSNDDGAIAYRLSGVNMRRDVGQRVTVFGSSDSVDPGPRTPKKASGHVTGHKRMEEVAVYLSRLTFATLPGHTRQVEEQLRRLRDLVAQAGGTRVRVLRTHFASLGAPDLVFEQEVPDLLALEQEIGDVVTNAAFQALSREISQLLARTPKREVYEVL